MEEFIMRLFMTAKMCQDPNDPQQMIGFYCRAFTGKHQVTINMMINAPAVTR